VQDLPQNIWLSLKEGVNDLGDDGCSSYDVFCFVYWLREKNVGPGVVFVWYVAEYSVVRGILSASGLGQNGFDTHYICCIYQTSWNSWNRSDIWVVVNSYAFSGLQFIGFSPPLPLPWALLWKYSVHFQISPTCILHYQNTVDLAIVCFFLAFPEDDAINKTGKPEARTKM